MTIERDRKKVPAQHKQGGCKFPGSQSRVRMRFLLWNTQKLSTDIKTERTAEKHCTLRPLLPMLVQE